MAFNKFNPERNELGLDKRDLVNSRIGIVAKRSLTQVWRNITLEDGQGKMFEPTHISVLGQQVLMIISNSITKVTGRNTN
jgi:hypothetical protein